MYTDSEIDRTNQSDPPNYPYNYPFCLFAYTAGHHQGLILAKNARAAAMKIRAVGADVAPLLITDLLKSFGHTGTTKCLRLFGDEWMAKDGFAFYKIDKESA